MRWRPMIADDVPAVTELADSIHRHYSEDAAVFANCLKVYPAGCHVLVATGRGGPLTGYLIAHPWMLTSPPPLNLPVRVLPSRPDCFYLHDLALAAEARGRGYAAAAVMLVERQARREGLHRIGLIAVGDAHGFWERQGFTLNGDGLIDPAKGYGVEARAFVRSI